MATSLSSITTFSCRCPRTQRFWCEPWRKPSTATLVLLQRRAMSEPVASPVVEEIAKRPRFSAALFYAILLPLLFEILLAGVGIGSTSIAWSNIIRVVALKLLPSSWTASLFVSRADEVIVWLIRIPRVVVAFFVGAGLAAAGVVMQGLFRNPLAEPGIVGAGGGAGLGGVISFVADWSAKSVITLPVMAMLGALLSLVLVYAMATRGGVTPVATLLLSGVAASALLGAASSLLLSL